MLLNEHAQLLLVVKLLERELVARLIGDQLRLLRFYGVGELLLSLDELGEVRHLVLRSIQYEINLQPTLFNIFLEIGLLNRNNYLDRNRLRPRQDVVGLPRPLIWCLRILRKQLQRREARYVVPVAHRLLSGAVHLSYRNIGHSGKLLPLWGKLLTVSTPWGEELHQCEWVSFKELLEIRLCKLLHCAQRK